MNAAAVEERFARDARGYGRHRFETAAAVRIGRTVYDELRKPEPCVYRRRQRPMDTQSQATVRQPNPKKTRTSDSVGDARAYATISRAQWDDFRTLTIKKVPTSGSSRGI